MRRSHIILLVLVLMVLSPLQAQETSFNLASIQIETGFHISDSVDNIGNLYIHYPGQHPTVWTFVNNDGSITVCTVDRAKNITYIYELSMNLELQKTLTVPNEYSMLGAFTKDIDGNYYFFFARGVRNQSDSNMAVQKYNANGEKVLTFRLTAMPRNSFGGVRIPFDAGTCRMEISGSMLAVYFAREMFNGHQASYGIVIDKDSFERIDSGAATNDNVRGGISQMPYTSHSFNQFILPIEDGFLFVDHGDAYPRSFTFAKFLYGKNTTRLHAYNFIGSTGQNATYAEMGGLAKTSDGFIFIGTCGKGNINNPRNLIIVTFDDELKACSRPNYITNYTRNDGHAGHAKITQIGENRFLVLWEMFKYSTQRANVLHGGRTEYLSTHMAVIDEKGAFVSEAQQLVFGEDTEEIIAVHTYENQITLTSGTPKIRLSMNDVLRYNPVNRKVYWAINNSSESIRVFALEVK